MKASFGGNIGSQAHRQRQCRITQLPISPTANAPGKVRARKKAKNTGKIGKETPAATISKTKDNSKNGLGCLVWPWRLCTTQQQECHSTDFECHFLESTGSQSTCGSLKGSIIPVLGVHTLT